MEVSYKRASLYSDSLKPNSIAESVTRIGLLTNMPSLARSSSCSSSLMFVILSFSPISLYSIPLVLKNFLSGNPLCLYHFVSSSFVGRSSLISLSSKLNPFSISQALAFFAVLHLEYPTNNISYLHFSYALRGYSSSTT